VLKLRAMTIRRLAQLRASDIACLCDADIAALFDQHTVRRIGFRELPHAKS